jgi:alkanesulfonate monooxygenase SsuD/methylene tetrahydromethanopterin reductase-like flavin-dependent oxidoreductase (luciferase family)
MLYGAILPGGTATEQLDQAVLAEQAGWDGVFVWEAAFGVETPGACWQRWRPGPAACAWARC